MTDWELWARANGMLRQHGNDAACHAAMRADALLESDDRQGHVVWIAIVRCIEKLADGVDEGVARH